VTQIFVYGTLMRGEERDGLVLHLNPVPATTTGRLWRAAAGYPALEYSPSGTRIAGELLKVDDPGFLKVLDMVEGVTDGLYTRAEIPVKGPAGEVLAWSYIMDSHQLRRAGCTPLRRADWRTGRR